MRKRKDVEVKARVSSKIKADLRAIAAVRDESLSLIVREAVGEYLKKKGGKK